MSKLISVAINRSLCSTLAAALALLWMSSTHAQYAQGPGASSGALKITSCVVYSTIDSNRRYNCLAVAAKACDGKPTCELSIGYNLTAGKDIDSKGGFLGKEVKVAYACGSVSKQGGPYHQNEHATLYFYCGQ